MDARSATEPAGPEREPNGPRQAPHAYVSGAVLAAFDVDAGTGLAEDEVQRRRERYGTNRLASRRTMPAIRVLLRQFASPVVYLLVAAMLLAVFMQEWTQGVAVAVVLAINTAIGFTTELRATRSMEALRRMAHHQTRVLRAARTQSVAAEDLVPGDIIVLEAGDRIPADLRIVAGADLASDESALTGELMPVAKHTDALPADTRLHEKANQLFKGTALVRGSGEAVVVHTGLDTELGRITRLVQEAEETRSPIEKRLQRLATNLVWLTLAIAGIIAALGVATGRPLVAMAETAIALAVAAIPEGLPVVATLALARGMLRMARRNAIVENLAAVETLGATTVILTDKTGTLTENRMTVDRLVLCDGEARFDHDAGRVVMEDRGGHARAGAVGPNDDDGGSPLQLALTVGSLCSNAALGRPGEADHGDPVETALLRAAVTAGLDPGEMKERYPEIAEFPFDSAARLMATLHTDGSGYLSAVKGAPEAVVARCERILCGETERPLTQDDEAAFAARARDLAGRGHRLLALAFRRGAERPGSPYEELVLLGLAALRDPPRGDVREAVRACRDAGIRVVMATGDHPATAAAIAGSVAIGADGEEAYEGGRIAAMNDSELRALGERSIFARVTPEEKLVLISALQDRGHVVAMTGDGVNDAPALKKADIGVAMGQRGTQVAREAADMVLRDDAFTTIVHAIREGRVIFANIRRFCVYLLSCNLSEIGVIAVAILSGLPLPLLPLQILFLNLVTDVFPAFALGAGEGSGDVLARPPRSPQEALLGRRQWTIVVSHGALMVAATLGAFLYAHTSQPETATTVGFLTIGLTQLWQVFNMRGAHSRLLSNDIVRNRFVWGAIGLCLALIGGAYAVPPLATVLELRPIGWSGWATVLGFSLLPLVVVQSALVFLRRRQPAVTQRL